MTATGQPVRGQRTAAIVGAGLTEVGKVYGRTPQSFAAEAGALDWT